MERTPGRPTVVVDLYTRSCLTAIAVLLTVLVIGLWATGPVAPAVSGAAPPLDGEFSGIGNPSAQRLAMVRALKATNEKLDKIVRVLENGKIRVVVDKDEANHAVPAQEPPKK